MEPTEGGEPGRVLEDTLEDRAATGPVEVVLELVPTTVWESEVSDVAKESCGPAGGDVGLEPPLLRIEDVADAQPLLARR